jgi:predicted TIM-barrel fold metal-dependent hydrolase
MAIEIRVAVAALTLTLAVGCNASPRSAPPASGADPDLAGFIDAIRAVDNHTHANSADPADADYDALPLDSLGPIEVPAALRPENPAWLAADQALFKYPYADLGEPHVDALRKAVQDTRRAQGEKFPTWVLDQVGTEVLLANRVVMGPGLTPPRFRWVSYVDALMLPLSTKAEAGSTPDREKLFPLEQKLLQRYLADLKLSRIPATLDAYLRSVVTPTLEAQKKGGCVAVKFEAAYLRPLDFDAAPETSASATYAKYAGGGEPPHADYKVLQDLLFRYIAQEAGRLGMAVHIHSLEGAGNYFGAAGANPLLLEPVLNDPALRNTKFVIVHGGGSFAAQAGALLWKPNVYVDMSLMTLAYPPSMLADVLKRWISQFPEKVLYGSDATALSADAGWEVAAWIASHNARTALAMALSDMMRNGEITPLRAREVATMVMRTNASGLYGLALK